MAPLEHLSVLVVEDDEDDFVLASDLLAGQTHWRFEVEWAQSYDAACTRIAAGPHDVYLIDYHLGARSGLDLVREAFPGDDHGPVILLTGQAGYEVDLEATRLGVTDFLLKRGLDSAELERSIRYAVVQHGILRELRHSRASMQAIIDNWPGAVSLQDTSRRFVALSQEAERRLGLRLDEVLGRTIAEIFGPEEERLSAERDAEVFATRRPVHFEVTLPGAEGRPVTFAATKFPVLDASGTVIGLGSVSLDITERKLAERRLAGAEARLRNLLESAPDAMVVTHDGGIIELVSAQTERIFGYQRDELVGQPFELLIPEHSAGLVMGEALDLHGRRKDGSEFPVEITLSPLQAEDGLLVTAAIRDVTERKRFEMQLEFFAGHDPLTGLLNRRRFMQELEREVEHAQRYGTTGAVLLLDLDNLKFINDTLGHKAGDELICAVAEIVRQRLRTTDILARLGGDEFAVILPVATRGDAARVAESVRAAIAGHKVLSTGRAVQTTVSIGLAPFFRASGTAEEIMVDADIAMYVAKDAGRDRVGVHSEQRAEHARVESSFTWSQRIRDALATGSFVLHAQPIVDVTTGEPRHYELLIRLVNEDGSLTAPASFLYVAERFGLVTAIDCWVVTQAIRLAEANPDTVFEVNLSGKSIGDPDVLRHIQRTLEASSAKRSNLVFEITETAAIAVMKDAQTFAERLRALGCRFALDDFGAGFGSFYYLKHLPVDYLKIDGEFIRRLNENRTDQVLVKAIVEVARGLGKHTIAECVEGSASQRRLQELGVDLAQGFGFSAPVPVSELFQLPDRGQLRRGRFRTGSVRVLICEDSPALRFLVGEWFAETSDLEIVGQAGNGAEALALARSLQPDVILLDHFETPAAPFPALVEEIRAAAPDAAVLLYSGLPAATIEQIAHAANLEHLLSKDCSVEELTDRLRNLADPRATDRV